MSKQEQKRKERYTCLNCPTNQDTVPQEAKIAQPSPISVKLEVGKVYRYCTCGFSEKQPFCDDTCKNSESIKGWEPLEFKVNEQQTVWSLCGCKRTGSAPLCDGSHINLKW